jgi:hypothetical protein
VVDNLWLMMVNNHLVGGSIPTPLKNDGLRQLGLLFPIYGKIKNIPNHQPDFEYLGSFFCAKFVAVGFKKHQLHLHILVPGVT